jgi:hypothetical protein
MLGATTRHKAADIWTKKYEVPKKAYEHLSRRRANADYFAQAAVVGPKSPQEAVDAAGGAISNSLAYAGDVSLTGADLPGSTAAAYASEKAAPRQKGPFESLLGGVTNMLDGVATGFNKLDKGVTSVENKVDSAIDGDTTEATSAAPAQAGNGGFFGETSGGAMLGSLVGGYFGGPMGAVVGGLVGQGINRSLTGMADQAQTDANAAESGGILGGVGRAVDGLFGGIGNMFGLDSASSSGGGSHDSGRSESRSSGDGKSHGQSRGGGATNRSGTRESYGSFESSHS